MDRGAWRVIVLGVGHDLATKQAIKTGSQHKQMKICFSKSAETSTLNKQKNTFGSLRTENNGNCQEQYIK